MVKTKRYISDVVGEGYKKWDNSKVILCAPTGSGKSKFILEIALPYWLENGKKVLILVNRNSLLKQYIYDQALRSEQYEINVTINTYQSFSNDVIKRGKSRNVFKDYDIVVMDEVHFLVSDSDFNPRDTYIMWQAILHSFGKCMIFMSATLEELEPFINEFEEVVKAHLNTWNSGRSNYAKFERYYLEADYDYIKPKIVPDIETLAEIMANSKKKSVIFIDDIERGKEIRDLIKEKNNSKKVICINADSQNGSNKEEKQTLMSLYMASRLDCDVLITTSVLDNGINIHDMDVENISIFTVSKSSFLQMLGRIRTEDREEVNLLLVPQRPEYWEQREIFLEEEVKEIEYLLKNKGYEYECDFLCQAVLDSSKKIDIYKKIFVLVPFKEDFPIYNGPHEGIKSRLGYEGKKYLIINRLAVAKIREILRIVQGMHVLSRRECAAPCYEQFSWIGKRREDVIIYESSYLKEEKDAMYKMLMEVQGFNKKEFSEWKQKFTERFRESLLKPFKIRAGNPIKEKDLKELLGREGLMLVIDKNDNRKNMYSIKEK